MKERQCPCHSGKPYAECCQPLHEGSKFPGNALELMRSRYSAYSLCLPDYILATTHPDNSSPRDVKSVKCFSKETQFLGLEIREFTDYGDIAYVTFYAHLSQHRKDASFTERSLFKKLNERWLYVGPDKVKALQA